MNHLLGKMARFKDPIIESLGKVVRKTKPGLVGERTSTFVDLVSAATVDYLSTCRDVVQTRPRGNTTIKSPNSNNVQGSLKMKEQSPHLGSHRIAKRLTAFPCELCGSSGTVNPQLDVTIEHGAHRTPLHAKGHFTTTIRQPSAVRAVRAGDRRTVPPVRDVIHGSGESPPTIAA